MYIIYIVLYSVYQIRLRIFITGLLTLFSPVTGIGILEIQQPPASDMEMCGYMAAQVLFFADVI